MVSRIEHHALGRAQCQDAGAHPRRIGLLAYRYTECGREFAVSHRCRASALIQGELHLEHDEVVRVLQRAVPVAESQTRCGYPIHLMIPPVEKFHAGHAVGDLDPVGADVLDRRRPSRAGDARQAFQSAEIGAHRSADDSVPVGSGLGSQQWWLDGDRGAGQSHNGEIGQVVGDHHVGSATEQQNRSAVGVEGAHRRDNLIGGETGDDTTHDRAHPQRGHRCQRHVMRDLRAAEIAHAR